MDQFLSELLKTDTNALGILDIFLTITIPFILTLFVAAFYRYLSRSSNYSVSFVHSLLLFSSLTSIITLLIGSSIARAFGLVAALSLIRFRTALKSPMDSIFMFWALAVGMSCGTGFYIAATMIVFLGILYMYLVRIFHFGDIKQFNALLKITISPSLNAIEVEQIEKDITQQLEQNREELKRINQFIDSDTNSKMVIYDIKLDRDHNLDQLQQKLQSITHIDKVQILNTEATLFI
jgi:translation elongation factor EF-1beta